MRRAVFVLLLLAACRKDDAPKPAAVPVRVERASSAVATVRYLASGPRISGTLQPQQSATILAETAGTVVAVFAAEGQRIEAGTPLARIADGTAAEAVQSAQVAVQSAQTAVTVAQRDYERSSRLAAAGALPTRDVEVARSQLATAQAQLGQARSQLATARDRAGNQNVVASTGGVVSEKQVSAGDVVAPGAPLFTIVDLGTLQLEATVPADALGEVARGAAVELEVRGYPGETFRGTVVRIAPTVDAATGQVRLYVSLGNQGRRLVGGLFAEGRVRTESRQSLVIPIEALDESGSTPTVVRVRNGVAERVTVQVGMRSEADGFVEIVAGLRAGDVVLTGPARAIAPGTKVSVG